MLRGLDLGFDLVLSLGVEFFEGGVELLDSLGELVDFVLFDVDLGIEAGRGCVADLLLGLGEGVGVG